MEINVTRSPLEAIGLRPNRAGYVQADVILQRASTPEQVLEVEQTLQAIKSNTEIASAKLRRDLSVLYAQVFAGEPWFEVSRCVICGSFSRESIGSQCSCGGILEEAYPQGTMEKYLLREMTNPGSVLAYIANEIGLCGFAWGYETIPTKLAMAKYRTPEMQGFVEQEIQAMCGNSIYYYSECGIRPDMRGQGIATRLSEEMAKNKPLVMRTNQASPMVKIAARLGMQRFGYYDAENPQRVMFYLQ